MDRQFRAGPAVSAREIEDELVLLDLEQGQFFVARGLGPRIWELLVEGTGTDEVVRIVSERYGVEAARARADVDAFVSSLLERGLLSG